MAATAGLRELTSAYRLNVREDGSVERLLSAVFDPAREQRARHFFGGFSFLEGLDEGSVQLPASREEFVAWASEFPKLRCRLLPPSMHVNDDIWLAADFRIARHLEALTREAQSFGFGFAYQAHFRPFVPDPDLQRRVGRNLIALQTAHRTPAEIVAVQDRLTKRLRTATLLVEEIVAVDRPDAAEWVAEALTRAFKADFALARLEVPLIKLANSDCGSDPALMMHGSIVYDDWMGDDLYCSQAEAEDFRSSLLCFRPPVDPIRRGGPRASGNGSSAPESPPTPFPSDIILPEPFEGHGHIFVSYRRTDLTRIAPIIRRLATTGFPVWYDRGISGGEEWDVVLERKIEEAGMMLVFLSQSTVESKYCRREIKFADAINKPLLIIALEATELRHGLKFLLQQLQQISAHDKEFEALLDDAIRKLLGTATASSS
jgi:hypothetical protein